MINSTQIGFEPRLAIFWLVKNKLLMDSVELSQVPEQLSITEIIHAVTSTLGSNANDREGSLNRLTRNIREGG